MKLKQFVQEADDVSMLEISDTSTHKKDNNSNLNKEVCKFFNEYQDLDSDAKKTCANLESLDGNKIKAVLASIESEYKRCESKETCNKQMTLVQKDNLSKIRSFI